MALRVAKKDVKKSSYYVWFLGAQEARSATGARQALSALTRLETRAASSVNSPSPPTKVTLQVSGRGLKIIQNIAGRTVKHLLPADSVTEARSRGDTVVCILLLYNPATRCPLHAHAYRCDSQQTAQALCSQLRAVAGLGSEEDDVEGQDESVPSDVESREVEIPARYAETRNGGENRSNSYDKRVSSREDRIEARGDRRERSDPRIDQRSEPRVERDSRIDGKERHSSHDNRVPPIEMRLAPEQEIVAERLAAELRTRLAGREPLLLPPRDYDTNRRPAVPQVSAKRNNRAAIVGSSAGSSGIGSDLAPSPERPHTSSEEDWGEISTAYMLHDGYEVSRSPPRRARTPSPTPIKHSARAAGSVSPKDRFNVAKEKFMNLEREKLNEEIEKRAQMKRNLNMVLSRGPMLPSDIKNERKYKWDDDDDIVLDRRAEMPRVSVRNDQRDMRRNHSREDRENSRGRDVRDFRDSRQSREMLEREYREQRSSRDIKDPLDMRDLRDQKPIRNEREYKDYRERDTRDFREYKESKEVRDPRYARDPDTRNVQDYRESRDFRDYKDIRDPTREYREPRDFKYTREYHNSREDLDEPAPRRSSREKTPQLEHRYYEYKGTERNDKYFDNRYKHDSRSDDEGVESEKQFEEIRYVPHVEVSRSRRDPELKSSKTEQIARKEPVRDGRIELLEERQRQIESGRMGRVPAPDSRFDRNHEVPVRDDKDWDVIRRSYNDVERPRRDARARHSYAEPVARTRVGMATVAPF